MRVAASVAFVAGVCWLQLQPELPSAAALSALVASTGALLLVVVLQRHALARHTVAAGTAIAAAVAGFAWAAAASTARLADELSPADEGREVVVEGVVSSLPARLERGVRFEFDVERVLAPDIAVPGRLLLAWYGEAVTVRPAERWQFAVRLKRPHGPQNPGGFDLEAWLLERNLRATGTVRSVRTAVSPRLIDPRVRNPGPRIERLRFDLRERLRPLLEGRRYGGVILALIVGDQRAIAAPDWTVFNSTLRLAAPASTTQLMALVERCRW